MKYWQKQENVTNSKNWSNVSSMEALFFPWCIFPAMKNEFVIKGVLSPSEAIFIFMLFYWNYTFK